VPPTARELTVDRDAHQVAHLFHLAAGQAERPQVPEHEVVVRAARLELVAVLGERGGQSAGVSDDLLGVLPEAGLRDLQKRSGDGCDCLVYPSTVSVRA
jgi:hypothetical protein